MFIRGIMEFVTFSNSETESSEAAIHKCPSETIFWKYAANLQESTYAEVATLLKSHFGIGVLL